LGKGGESKGETGRNYTESTISLGKGKILILQSKQLSSEGAKKVGETSPCKLGKRFRGMERTKEKAEKTTPPSKRNRACMSSGGGKQTLD